MLKRTDLEIKRQEVLFSFLQHIREKGGTLVINGDLFDFYFEYKDVIPKVFFPFYYEIL
jgi:UDP-2,3-diacylglucosamine hydrolase